jgi:hypothetical protein
MGISQRAFLNPEVQKKSLTHRLEQNFKENTAGVVMGAVGKYPKRTSWIWASGILCAPACWQ